MAVVFDSGFGFSCFAIQNGKNARVVAKADLVGGAPAAVDPWAIKSINALLAEKQNTTITSEPRLYNKTEFDAWEAASFAPAAEPEFVKWTKAWTYPA